ncbi:MAG: DedA family protein [Pseudonocardiaceae bacterium]
MASWVFSIVDRLGAAGVGLLVLLENVIPPIPSEVILPLAGFRAEAGALNVWLVWPAATAGSVTGALVLYGLGRWLGHNRLRQLANHKWFIMVSQGDLDRGERLFRDHGSKIVLLGRMVPIIRSIVSVPAGVAGMPIPRFVLLTAIGSGIWNALFIGLGWYLRENYAVIEAWLVPVGYTVLGLIVAGLGWLALRRLRSRYSQLSTKPSR